MLFINSQFMSRKQSWRIKCILGEKKQKKKLLTILALYLSVVSASRRSRRLKKLVSSLCSLWLTWLWTGSLGLWADAWLSTPCSKLRRDSVSWIKHTWTPATLGYLLTPGSRVHSLLHKDGKLKYEIKLREYFHRFLILNSICLCLVQRHWAWNTTIGKCDREVRGGQELLTPSGF